MASSFFSSTTSLRGFYTISVCVVLPSAVLSVEMVRTSIAEETHKGYAYIQYDSRILVWNEEKKLILVVSREKNTITFLCHDSADGRKAFEALVGVAPGV